MSEEGDKTCPLCAEEMDLTDQQLKPCKCGYEICVWCWHHIMDMAEKDETEGRCPACRTAYNKEKIVGTGTNSGRVVSEMNLEKRHKSHKGKSKTSEGRKQLGSARVIQRNLVYVVGLPLSFAEEDLLQRRDCFGQYGKVLKVSISQTASGAIQQFANSTCSVYITYSKEEEAVRCIQSVHGFVLDGRPLRACFGTTKYCHAWLRNMPCSNPDCLYLHEIGSQEDSFTKDEIISAYTRTRVQQITGTSNSIQRRSGNVLPPPADEYFYNSSASSGNPITTTATNTNQNSATSFSPPNSSSGRSAALPAGASWGSRPTNNQPLPTITTCSDGLVKQKSDTSNGPVALCTAVASPSQVHSLRTSIGKKIVHNEEANIPQDKSKIRTPDPVKEQPIAVSESSYAPTLSETLPINNREPINGPLSSKSPSNTIHIIDFSTTSTEPVLAKGSNDAREGDVENMCSSVLSMSIHENQQVQNHYIEYIRDKPAQQPVETESKEVRVTDVHSDLRLGMPSSEKPVNLHEVEDDLLSFDNQRAKDPEIATNRMQDFPNAFHLSKHSFHSSLFSNPDGLINGDLNSQVVDRDSNFIVPQHNNPSGNSQKVLDLAGISNGGYSNIFPSKEKGSLLQGYDGEVPGETVNVRESSIISDILSMDFDPWDESLTSPTNLARLFGKTDTRGSFGTQGSVGASGSRKSQHGSQSKFSFAREQEPIIQVSDFGRPVDYFEQAFKQRSFGHDVSSSNILQHEKSSTRNGFPVFHSTESDIFANSHLSINKNAASRSQISAPPGFSAPSKAAAPPGFTPHDRTEQIFDALSANHMLVASSLTRNQYQTPLTNNMYNNNDIEFMDPAILAVGRGTIAGGMNNPGLGDMMSSYTPQTSTYEEARFQSLRQRSLPPHQNQRFADMGDRFSTHGDAYGLPSRVMDHGLANNRSPYSQFNLPQSRNGVTSNGQWDSWNENQGGNNMGTAELLRNDRFGFNNFYANYEDSEIRMPTSGNLYNGAYGI